MSATYGSCDSIVDAPSFVTGAKSMIFAACGHLLSSSLKKTMPGLAVLAMPYQRWPSHATLMLFAPGGSLLQSPNPLKTALAWPRHALPCRGAPSPALPSPAVPSLPLPFLTMPDRALPDLATAHRTTEFFSSRRHQNGISSSSKSPPAGA
jgi:hypothetical protein